jgi:hypothetical protein
MSGVDFRASSGSGGSQHPTEGPWPPKGSPDVIEPGQLAHSPQAAANGLSSGPRVYGDTQTTYTYSNREEAELLSTSTAHASGTSPALAGCTNCDD